MSNCYSSQGEYSEHDFKGGVCKDCGEADAPGIREMSKRVEALESLVDLHKRDCADAERAADTAESKVAAALEVAEWIRDHHGDYVSREIEERLRTALGGGS